MDRTTDDELADELCDLTRQLREQLLRHAAIGTWAAPGGATARNVVEAEAMAEPMMEARAPELREPASQEPRAEMRPEMRPEPRAEMRPEPRAEMRPEPRAEPRIEASEPSDAPRALGRRTLTQIREDLGECTRCKLSTTRNSIVFGVGPSDTPLMFVGEAPGEQEDKRGEPFVGPAGQLLDKMIEAMGWTRGAVYIANTTKCRPPNNRNPQPDELAACIPFLHAQIEAVAPRIIVSLGRPAANQLLENNAPIGSLRGRFHDYARFRGLRIMPTFHPAYLLRDPDKKRLAWADLKLVMAELERLGIAPPGRS